MDRRNIKTILL